ncbi:MULTISPECIES: porin [unclassified Rhizobium]|uniref:porin n=1 Tax=unclassified Rhizobium TaxID=2613769 RepID=UPI001ADD11D7|nr:MULTISPECIES: porin [unclassified Rhizobium]MBO9125432.1 porin [Rhizobium sp. 16-488-2b]MBO9176017.1 porin [Rhizobium sp. 16-488-2a]
MTIRSILLGSAAAMSIMPAAQAADAIVAAEPEAVEYVRVCDAYGTGYFYIPGTETCLSIGGYIRVEERFGRDRSGTSDWSSWTRGQVTLSSKSETEYGTLTGVITLRTNAENATNQTALLQEGYIDLAGFRVGMQYSWWDNDRSIGTGETDVISSNQTIHNSVRYMYETPNFSAGVSVDELEERYRTKPGEGPNNVGVTGQLFGKAGAVSGYLLAGYDTDTEEVALRGIVFADVGPGQLGVYGLWASGANYYYEESEWALGAQYVYKATDKLSIIPGYQYFSKISLDSNGEFTGGDAWRAGVTVDYKIAKNLLTKLSVQYYDPDNAPEQVQGFLRFQRTF